MRVRVGRGQHGLSLIEVTIMLLVLMLLTGVMAPSIFDFIVDAQWVKAKEDCDVIAVSLTRLIKDVSPKLLYKSGTYPAEKMDLMLSNGAGPSIDIALAPEEAAVQVNTIHNWFASSVSSNLVRGNVGNGDCDQQLVSNLDAVPANIYPNPTGATYGLGWGNGWRGSYIAPPCGPDPWGNAYQVNTKWLTPLSPGAPNVYRWHCNDVFCLSAGKDGIIQTPFAFAYIRRGGDDLVVPIAPCDP